MDVCVRKQQSCLTQSLHRATLSCYLGHSDLYLGVSLSTCRHVPFATDSCLVSYATTVKHLQINQRKISVRLLLGQELYAEQEHVGHSNSAGGAPNFLVLCTACWHFWASRPVTGSSEGNGRNTFHEYYPGFHPGRLEILFIRCFTSSAVPAGSNMSLSNLTFRWPRIVINSYNKTD